MQTARNGKERGIFSALGIGRRAGEPAQRDSAAGQAVAHRPGSALTSPASQAQIAAVDSVPPVSRLIAIDAAGHAEELLAWLQGPGGRTGSIASSDLAIAHAEMCELLEIEPIGWTAVSRELRRLLGEPRRYVDRQGRRVRVFRIPPAGVQTLPRAAARWAQLHDQLPRAA